MSSAAPTATVRVGTAVRASTAVSVLAVAFGAAVVTVAAGRAAALVLACCVATLAVPLSIRSWGGRAPDADARFVRVLVSLSGYLLPMAAFQAGFGP
jgi:hypothetical protein